MQDAAETRPRTLWRTLRWRGLQALAALIALPLVLTIVYTVVPPFSLPMIGRAIVLQDVDRRWVSLDDMAPSLVEAVLSSEDARFCQHWGVDFVELSKVLATQGGPSRGASTISMQVAKNLFLWPLPGWLRKPFEIPLALWIDLVWSKKRVIEVYLNVAEWGEGIYGAEAAAEAHFGKPASKLSIREAALLAAALPNPIKRDASMPSGRMRGTAGVIAARARQSGDTLDCVK